jgi:hypothetical protein
MTYRPFAGIAAGRERPRSSSKLRDSDWPTNRNGAKSEIRILDTALNAQTIALVIEARTMMGARFTRVTAHQSTANRTNQEVGESFCGHKKLL